MAKKIHRKNYILAFLVGLWFTLALATVLLEKANRSSEEAPVAVPALQEQPAQ